MKNRIVALFLIFAMLFGMTSCALGTEIPPKDRPLEIETEQVVYTSESIDAICDSIVEISDFLLPILGASKLKDKSRTELRSYVSDTMIPIAKEIPIYQSELSELCDVLKDGLARIDTDAGAVEKYGAIASVYARAAALIDVDRLGELTYRLNLASLRDSLDEAQKKYDKNGNSVNLRKLEKYKALVADAEALGSDAFSDAFSVLMFIVSASLGSVTTDGGVISFKAADVLAVLEKQGERFSSLDVSAEQWQTVVAMCEEFIPEAMSGSPLLADVTWSLDDENYFTDAAVIMPDVIDFYAALTSGISGDVAEKIADGTELAIAEAICSELVTKSDVLDAFLLSLTEKIPPASESLCSIAEARDPDGYREFCSSYSATRQMLILGVEQFAADPTEENYQTLKDLTLGFARELNPVVAYVYFYL